MTDAQDPTTPDPEVIDAADYDQVDSGAVEAADPDLTVPGESDTAESGGQGADDRYVGGDLGGGAIGGSIADNEKEGDQA